MFDRDLNGHKLCVSKVPGLRWLNAARTLEMTLISPWHMEITLKSLPIIKLDEVALLVAHPPPAYLTNDVDKHHLSYSNF